jgi:hypothetical protein
MPTTKALVASRRLLALMLLLVGIATASGGCIVVPVGGRGGPRHAAIVAPLPVPVVVVRPYRAW